MYKYMILAGVIFASAGCSKKQEESTQSPQTARQPMSRPAVKQDVSTAALVKIDPDIAQYEAVVAKAKKAYVAKGSAATKAELVKAYMDFGNYIEYESQINPRQGKYHRALIEYRHALQLDPGNEKAKQEIAQIEDIYRSMRREIPTDDPTL